ncbi:hypothetical protein TraAM80_02741 [Trypanosoma rangeli]|uniref:Uncharacterized protein n=1 Tax=Trypanosoma rangeli TaxID=5698 RepID=A0A422NSM5_TRYRA|nr:uncharacterized protein TraAM80_02741 [Trypanosoma rangeli]RNF08439.1 hypothetical protein TraAM80_02741 [Trypanosoma rangeli]|eukprot:RNF08439.1 hypothetical protein TraAM80_02741 [Trypanosoma rangeli]
MRRSVFFMGRTLTQRHLNACRSPLLTGYIRPTAISCTARGLATSPLAVGALLGPSASSGSPLPTEDLLEGALTHTVTTLLARSLSMSLLAEFMKLQNGSTCVTICERVFGAMVLSLPSSPGPVRRGLEEVQMA